MNRDNTLAPGFVRANIVAGLHLRSAVAVLERTDRKLHLGLIEFLRDLAQKTLPPSLIVQVIGRTPDDSHYQFEVPDCNYDGFLCLKTDLFELCDEKLKLKSDQSQKLKPVQIFGRSDSEAGFIMVPVE